MEFVIGAIYIGVLIFWIWTLVDILKNDFEGSGKIVWLLVVFFLSLFGSLLYVLIGRKQKIIKIKS